MSETKMSVDEVKRLATDTIKLIDDLRERSANEYAKEWIGWRNWLRRRFRMKEWTVKEAVLHLNTRCSPIGRYCHFFWVVTQGAGQRRTARRLLALAEKSVDGQVTVSADDFVMIDID